MSPTKPKKFTLLQRWFRLTQVRIASQIFFMGVFLFFCWASWTSRLEGYPVSRILEMDPLVLISTLISSGFVYRALGWGLFIIAITLLFGRVFCNWICPYGTLHQFTGWLFNLLTMKNKIDSNRYREHYAFKYIILIAFLVMAALGTLQIGLLDPICLMYRSVATALSPLWDSGIHLIAPLLSALGLERLVPQLLFAPGVSDRIFVGSYWISVMLLGLVSMNLFVPRFFCRVLCPLGALLGVLSRKALFRINRDVSKCTDCNLCLSRCEGAADPQAALRQSECFSCMNCIDDCPEDALSFTAVRQDKKQVIEAPALSRRQAVYGAVAGVFMAMGFKNNGANDAKLFSPKLIRPPGSLAEPDFLQQCIKCDQCINVCPTNVLQPAGFIEGGFEALWTPVMNFKVGHCQLKCNLCSVVCPTGAIREISVAEKMGLGPYQEQGPVRLGTAFFDIGRCLPHAMEIPCVVCEEVCPVTPKAIQTNNVEIKDAAGQLVILNKPFMVPELCIGCGICETECPVQDSPAVYVTAVGESRSDERRLLLHDRFQSQRKSTNSTGPLGPQPSPTSNPSPSTGDKT
jgi:polyferredoxin